MRKYLLLSSFLISAGPLAHATQILELSLNPSQKEIEQIAHAKFPREFQGVNDIDQTVVDGFRKTQLGYKGIVSDTSITLHEPAIYPLAAKFKGALNSFAANESYTQIAERFINEMHFHDVMEDVNPAWLYGLHLRFAAAVSPITADQKTLFSHVPFPSIFFGLLEKDAWKNEASAFSNVEYYDNKGFEIPEYYISYHLSGQMIDSICDVVERALPAKVMYPFVNQDKFGVSFIVRSNINDIYPIALPFYEKNPKAKAIAAHGTELSTFPFATHDELHSLVDRRRNHFIQHVIKEIDWEVEAEGDAWEFARVYIPIALQRYHMVNGLLNHIYNDMVGTLLPHRGLAEYRKAMLGYFWIDHEAPYFPSSIYDMNDVDKIINTITSLKGVGAVSGSINEIDSWSSPYDPLETSPIDGSSRLSDDEIYQFVEEKLTTADSNGHKYDLVSYPASLQYDIKEKKIARGDRFIDVFYRYYDGCEYQFSFPTMYHKWLNADDNLGLLQYGGTRIKKPAFLPNYIMGAEDPRVIAQNTLAHIEQAINGHVIHFRNVASFFVNRGEENSLAKRYFKRHFNQEKKLLY